MHCASNGNLSAWRTIIGVAYHKPILAELFRGFLLFYTKSKAMNIISKPIISSETLKNSVPFETFFKMMETWVAQGATSGPKQEDGLIKITELNLARIKRLEKQVVVMPEAFLAIQNITKPMHWFVMLEGWCADAAQSISAMHKMAALNPLISLHIIFRDENPTVMDAFLTNGSRSIPKLIFTDAQFNILGHWGPRPQVLSALIVAWKKDTSLSKDDVSTKIHQWYTADKTIAVQQEIVQILNSFASIYTVTA